MLDDRKYLIPCKGGEHLQYCKNFECNMKYKCPNYYCIPWAYVCDGKFDCPSGLEEQNCKVGRNCENMFKCKDSQICIHLNDICDGKFDCPSDEDELLCTLHGTWCPPNCECLIFTIRCFSLSTVDFFSKVENPFDVIIIHNSTRSIVNTLLKYLQNLSILKLSRNNLDELCAILPQISNSLLIDAGFNNIYRLKSKCFMKAFYLKIIKLNNNQISSIDNGAFKGLNELIVLDLSCNLLIMFSTLMFSNVAFLCLLKLKGNDIKFISHKSIHEMNIQFIESNVHLLTCIPNLEAKLLSKRPWFLSCNNFLLNKRFRICSFCIFTIIFICNTISIIQNCLLIQNCRETAFLVSALYFNVTDTLHGLYILYLFSVDLYYGEYFAFHQIQWISSHMCFIGFSTALNLAFLSPILSCFLAMERLMVVLFPVNTKFKSKGFIRKCTFTITLITIFITASITVAVQSIYKQIPFPLCSPFVDPTKSIFVLKIISFFVIWYLVFAVLFILGIYFVTFISIQKSRRVVATQFTHKQSNLSLFVHLITISTSCFICWVPSASIYLTTWILETYPIEIIVWTAIAITPINSILNSLVSIITTRRFLKGSLASN